MLEFDHLRDKTKTIAQLAHEGARVEVLAAEIAKCEVVCCNCHRRRTGRRRAEFRAVDSAPSPPRTTRQRNVRYVQEVLAGTACLDCGLDDPAVLEFDHVDEKTAAVAFLVWRESSLETIRREIARCVVRCANCHRRKTARDGGHYRYVATLPL